MGKKDTVRYNTRQQWYQSKPLWRAILSTLVIIIKEVFDYKIPDALIDSMMNIILYSVVIYGIRNNPSLKGEL